MPDIPMVAFKTTDPEIVAAWKTTVEQIREVSDRAIREAEEIGKNKGLMIQRGLTDETFIGLAPLDPSDPPEGWRYVREQFEPRRGKAGDDARAWLASIERPSMRRVMSKHGLPEVTTFKYGFMGRPGMVMHDDTVFAIYKGGPDGDVGPGWEPCRPSEFYAAQEDAEVAR
jgi:hypothetical protein